MKLTQEDQWMLSYLKSRIEIWEDVCDGATRTIERINTREDLVDWANCFLPSQRRVELKKALINFKIQQGSKRHMQRNMDETQMRFRDRAAKFPREEQRLPLHSLARLSA